jgi:hypothetical protein
MAYPLPSRMSGSRYNFLYLFLYLDQGRPCGRPPAAALFTAEGSGDRTGLLVEFDNTDSIFTHPADKRTEDSVTGRFG